MIENFLNKNYKYAIVGASNNENKFGYKIVKNLKENNFIVIPINPIEKEILGIKVYKNISEVSENIDIVNFVIPPNITIKVLKEISKKGIKKVWFQKGSFNEECIDFCKKNKIEFLYDYCLLKESENYK